MRLKLPLLMASSLLWQAAAWGDEWVDYATAVTVTDGYLCSGELYGDSTGTDILCDAGNPFVDGDGNVGIGTATPSTLLHLRSTDDNILTVEADSGNSDENDNPLIHLTQDGGSVSGYFGLVGDAGEIYTDSLTNATFLSSRMPTGAQVPFALQLVTDSAARLTVTADGDVGLGTIAPSYKLHVNGTAYATGAAGALSDRRHKKNITKLSNGALDKILQLRPVTFEWNEPKDDGMLGRQYGFIAQEVEKIIPEIVLTQDDKDKTKGLKPTAFIPWLVKSDQELKVAQDAQTARLLNSEKKIESLEAEIAHLKSQINLILSLQPESALAH